MHGSSVHNLLNFGRSLCMPACRAMCAKLCNRSMDHGWEVLLRSVRERIRTIVHKLSDQDSKSCCQLKQVVQATCTTPMPLERLRM